MVIVVVLVVVVNGNSGSSITSSHAALFPMAHFTHSAHHYITVLP